MSVEAGRINRDRALERVSSGDAKQEYLRRAAIVLLEEACRRPDFTTDDIRDRAPVPAGMEPRVLGPLILAASKRGIIVKTGERRNTRYSQANARDQAVWTLAPEFSDYRIIYG